VTMNDAGAYQVIVSDQSKILASDSAILTVTNATAQKLEIIQQPAAQTIFAGETASFSVTAVSSSTLIYQWSKDGTSIPGATGATLTIPNATVDQSGSYAVVVADGNTILTSASAQLTVKQVVISSGRLLNIDYGAHLNPNFPKKVGPAAIGSAGD